MAKHKPRVYAPYPKDKTLAYEESQDSDQEMSPKPEFPQSVKIRTDREAVLEFVQAHNKNKAYTKDKKPGSVRILKLDDITAYDISETEENMLWEVEVDRLLQSVQSMGSVVAFSGSGVFPEQNTETAYDELSKLADQLLINLHICRVDNGTVLYDLSRKNHSDGEYANSFRILTDRQDIDRSEREKAAEASHSPAHMAKYCTLVDYVTAVSCRIATSAFEDKTWHALVISALAKYAAKLKVLAMDPEKFTPRSIHMATVSKQYKAMLDGIGNTLRMMQKQSASGAFAAEFEAPNNGNDGADDDEDDDGDVRRPGQRLYPRGAFPYMNHPNYMPFGGGMGISGLGGSGLGGGGGMGGGLGGLGMGGGGMGGQWYAPLYSKARLKELEAFTKKTDADESSHYFSYMTLINDWTSGTLLQILQELKSSFLSDLPSDGFDICSTVYEAGTVDCVVPVLIHQDRGLELSATNNVNLVHQSYMGFWIAQQAAAGFPGPKMKKDRALTRPVSMSVNIELRNEDNGSTSEPIRLEIQNLSQAISILIPLLCTSPDFILNLGASITNVRQMFSIDIEDHLLPKAPRFTGVISLKTETFESRSAACLPQSDSKSLSWSILTERERQATLGLKHTSTQMWDKMPDQQKKQQLKEVKIRQNQLAKVANDWVFEETAIRVNCAQYVYTVIGICIGLTMGGLMIGIFLGTYVKNSIVLQGVDPFGFTTYAWVIAGFIMLIAKNIRVTEWPWRDFLLRRVTCRSLSELHAVTGVDEQDLLVYLLTMEYENVLKTKGPHNVMFKRREAHGFSIDCKPKVRTLLAAGIIFIKVLVRKEPVLICLDLRAGSKEGRTSIRHYGSLTNDDIVCRYPPSNGDRVQDIILNQRQRHWDYMELNLKWDRIVGIYHDWDREVR
ncbi:hypothetical protein BX600DRAFT_469107 [Xylariales sp. PMI_506]|nr:hypothetical protein BX600DRAFT_469107 [Xylariales sp. PMI_506]